MNNILELNGLSEDLLQTFSYKTLLGISLKKNLHYFKRRTFRRIVWICFLA